MRILFTLISLFVFSKIGAQNLDSIRHLWQQHDLGRAKELIDHYTDSTENAEGWFLKAKVYESISRYSKYRDLVADPKAVVFQSLKYASYYKEDYLQLIKNDSVAFNIYEGYTNDGVAFFNAGAEKQDRSDYAKALENFKKAADIKFFIRRFQSLPEIDTLNLLYSAKAAIYAENEPEALNYSKKILDAGIAKADFEPVDQWLLYYYRQKKDEYALLQYSSQFKKLFPKSSFYYLNYIDHYREISAYREVFEMYDKLFKIKEFDKPVYRYAYIQDLFNYLYVYKATLFPDNSTKRDWRDKLEVALTNYTWKNLNDAPAKLLFGKFYINKAVDKQAEEPGIDISRLLIRSNEHLKDVADKSPKADKNLKIEAVKLLIGNYGALKQATQVRRYNLILKKMTQI